MHFSSLLTPGAFLLPYSPQHCTTYRCMPSSQIYLPPFRLTHALLPASQHSNVAPCGPAGALCLCLCLCLARRVTRAFVVLLAIIRPLAAPLALRFPRPCQQASGVGLTTRHPLFDRRCFSRTALVLSLQNVVCALPVAGINHTLVALLSARTT